MKYLKALAAQYMGEDSEGSGWEALYWAQAAEESEGLPAMHL